VNKRIFRNSQLNSIILLNG